jgi:hypothetical protein
MPRRFHCANGSFSAPFLAINKKSSSFNYRAMFRRDPAKRELILFITPSTYRTWLGIRQRLGREREHAVVWQVCDNEDVPG